MPDIDRLKQMLADDPDDAFLNYGLAMEYSGRGDTEAALAQFDRVIALDADHVAARFQKGQLLAREGELEAARVALNDGIAIARRTGDEHAEGEMTEFLEML